LSAKDFGKWICNVSYDASPYCAFTCGIPCVRPAVPPGAGQLALSLLGGYREATDPERYHAAAWRVIRHPYANPFQYRFALLQAETACRLAPEQGRYRTALGAAQYRAGHYKEALSALAKADALHRAELAGLAGLGRQPLQLLAPLCQARPLGQAVPANLPFLAMAHHRLGQNEQARAALARLREASRQAPSDKDEEAHDLLRQAEAVMAAKGRDTKR
jgi:tetratricopeptide (TPR) repeat protein